MVIIGDEREGCKLSRSLVVREELECVGVTHAGDRMERLDSDTWELVIERL